MTAVPVAGFMRLAGTYGAQRQSAELISANSLSLVRYGRIEKYLCRQGSQRYAGTDSHRHKNADAPLTCSAEMRFSS
jgi:hypothetical protein